MDAGMSTTKVTQLNVQAEWALKGKEPTDAGYRLLNSSRQVLSADNFEQALERYSPGTLETLPQVTVSWLEDKSGHRDHPSGAPVGRSYVAVAIHDQSPPGVVDAAGREFVMTSYYCVDYRSLRERNVSYMSMYEGFKDVGLYGRPHGYIKTGLGATQPMPPEYTLTFQAAGLLLTDKPVCILGADDAPIEQRLTFIDEVASLLPYGMRSRLSASTWTSSTYKKHNFRLFFSSVERDADDFHLFWGASLVSTGLAIADTYIGWLSQNTARKVLRLAADRQEMGFGIEQVQAMLARVGVYRDQRTVPAMPVPAVPVPAVPPRPQVATPDYATPVPPESADHLLAEITNWLVSTQPDVVERFIPRLRKLIRDDLADTDRERYQQIISQHKLLREDLKINRDIRAELYRTLLRLAYGVPINYVSYCAIERSLGNDWAVHEPLARAIYEVGAHEVVQLLALGSIGQKPLNDSLRKRELRPKRLVDIITNPNLQEDHRQFLCDVALRYLEERPQRFSPEEIEAAFAPAGFLADILFQVYRQDPQTEFSMLNRVLQIIYGHKLNRETVVAILGDGNFEHTSAFYAVLLELADDYCADDIIWSGFNTLLLNRGFSPDTQYQLTRKLAAYRPADLDPEGSGKSRRKFKSMFTGAGRKPERGAEVQDARISGE